MASSAPRNSWNAPQALFPSHNKEVNWLLWAIVAATLFGLLSWVIPVYIIAAVLLGLGFMAYLFLNPDKAFYLAIFTIPFTDRVRVLPISFSLNELIILYAAFTCAFHTFIHKPKFSLKTGIDGWILLLCILFFLAGFFSSSDTGLLGFFKIAESFLVFYMSILLLRTKQVTRADIIRILMWTALFQASLGIFQSITGIGADFQSERGYLGYLGLGSSHVWHGRGTTWHFNTLGNFLVINWLILLPIFFRHAKHKWRLSLFMAVILLGIITTYSRGSLLGLMAGLVFYMAISQKSVTRSMIAVGALVLIVFPLAYTLSNSSYVNTVSYEERLIVWQVPLAAITQSAKTIWLGSGLNSYAVVAWPFVPAWVPVDQYRNWFAHNFYLLTVVEVGLIGAILLFSFLIYLWLKSWWLYTQNHGAQKTIAALISVAMIGVFFVSIFDHTFASPHYKVFIFLLLSLLYAKPSLSQKRKPY